MSVDVIAAAKQSIRVVAVYATRWNHQGELAIGPERYFDLGRLEEYYALAVLLATIPVLVFTYLHGWVWLKSLFSRRPLHPWRLH